MWFRKAAHVLDTVIGPMSRVANGIGMVMLMGIMLIISVDVMLRFLFNLPVLGSLTFELVLLMLTIMVFFGMAYAGVVKGHVSVDVLVSRLPKQSQTVIEVIANFFSAGVVLLITWQLSLYANVMRQGGVTSQILAIPIWPFALMGAAGMALFFAVLLIELLKSLAQALEERCWKLRIALLSVGIIALVLLVAPAWLNQWLPHTISPPISAIICIGILFLLLISKVHIGVAMALVGVMGMTYLIGIDAGLSQLGRIPFIKASSYNLSVIPLFILMGEFAFAGGLTDELYSSSRKWFGRMPGGLAITTIAACAGFAAACGSSAATAATMGKIALPEMKKYGYHDGLATGSIAAGGTLGILIPPSIGFIIYAILTEASIGKLFMAGIFPGLLLSILFMLTIYVRCHRNIQLGPPGPEVGFREKLLAIKNAWAVAGLFLLVVVGIYIGVFTPTEASALGCLGAFLIAIVRRKLTWTGFVKSILGAGQLTAMILLLIMGASILNVFLAVSKLPFLMSEFILTLHLPSLVIIVGILCMYLVLGCIAEIYSMMILTLPILLPTLETLGIDLIWFGVIMVLIIEMGLITPPVGMNVYIIRGMAPSVPIENIFRGIAPFLIMMMVTVMILIIFPQIALFLPFILK